MFFFEQFLWVLVVPTSNNFEFTLFQASKKAQIKHCAEIAHKKLNAALIFSVYILQILQLLSYLIIIKNLTRTNMLSLNLGLTLLLMISLTQAINLNIAYQDTLSPPVVYDAFYGSVSYTNGKYQYRTYGGQIVTQDIRFADGTSEQMYDYKITQNSCHLGGYKYNADSSKIIFYYARRSSYTEEFSPLQRLDEFDIKVQSNGHTIWISDYGNRLIVKLQRTVSGQSVYEVQSYKITQINGAYTLTDKKIIESQYINNQATLTQNGRFFTYMRSNIAFVVDLEQQTPVPQIIMQGYDNILKVTSSKGKDNLLIGISGYGFGANRIQLYDWNSKKTVLMQTLFSARTLYIQYYGKFIWLDGQYFNVGFLGKQNPDAWTISWSNDLLGSQRSYLNPINQAFYRQIVVLEFPGIALLGGYYETGIVFEKQIIPVDPQPVDPQPVVVDCALDPASTSLSISDSECQCLLRHSWDPQLSKCVINCKTQFSLSPIVGNSLKCECEERTIWDQRQKQCVIDCPAVLYSTGQWVTKEICKCYKTSEWNPRTLACDPKCQNQLLSTGVLSGGACECVNTARWNSEIGVCEVDCSLVGHALYDKPIPGEEACQCQEGYVWNGQACQILDCSLITYADLNAQHSQGSCVCLPEFNWDSSLNQCKIDCSRVSGDLHQSTNADIHSCLCQNGAFWEASALMCFIDCSSIVNALDNINYAECSCSEGYAWNQGQCLTTCGERVGEQQAFNAGENRCQCLAGFSFQYNSPEGGACYRSCSSISYTQGEFGQSPGSCSCIQGFEWNQATNACEILCEGPYDSAVATQSTCSCIGSAVFISAISKCMPVCSTDPLSTGSFNSDSYGCYCKVNAHWDKSTAACVCNSGYEKNVALKKCEAPSITVGAALGIGGGVLSGVAVFIGMKMQRRKREKEPEHVEEVDSLHRMKKHEIHEV